VEIIPAGRRNPAISKVGKIKEKSRMPDVTGANRDEIHRAIEALTAAELLRLKHFSAWRMRALGRALADGHGKIY
jgi:hypothetical protein